MKKCPYCAEKIREEATKCRYCGEWVMKKYKGHISPAIIEESPKPGFETAPAEVITKEQEKPPSLKDIPRFALGRFYISATLILWTFWGIANLIILIWSNIDNYFSAIMFSELVGSIYQLTTINLTLSILAIINIAVSILILISALGLRKRKRYGLILTYLITICVIIAGIVGIMRAEEIYLWRFCRALIAWISFGWLVYFYGRRKYFNR